MTNDERVSPEWVRIRKKLSLEEINYLLDRGTVTYPTRSWPRPQSWGTSMLNKAFNKPILIPLTDKELNYIEGALAHDIRSLGGEMQLGNIPQLLWFQKRLLGKVVRLHRAGLRKVRVEAAKLGKE